VQPTVQNIITAATARLESARQTNSPADMRAAIESFETALRDLRTQLAPCATAAADPHAGHTMPSTQSAPAAGAPTGKPPAAADPHAGHQMRAGQPTTTAKPQPVPPKPPAQADPHAGHQASPAAKPPKPTAKPAPTQKDPHAGHSATPSSSGAKSAPAKTAPTKGQSDPHAGHAPEAQAGKQMDPVNGLMVDPATAPTTVYQGQTYYFSSEESRKEFLANPAKFAKKPKR
jgi:YHS domain-containing protein